MYVILLGKRLYRLMVAILVLLLILPAIGFYAARAINPLSVNYRQPRGEALKVTADGVESEVQQSTFVRFLYFLHDFYENGL